MMIIQFELARLTLEWPSSVVCIGTFDGIHLGHRRVVETAVARAKASQVPSVAITFDRHPAAVLAPEKRPPYIASLEDDLAEFERLGIDMTVVLPFDAALSRMSASAFLKEVLLEKVHAQELVVGHDFALGNDRVGTAAWLSERIPTTAVPPFEMDGQRVSSSQVRELISVGHIAQSNRLLGRPFRIAGVVIHGQKLGRTLGFPTANLARSFDQVTPLDGVYEATATTRFGQFRAALAIGLRPAVGGTSRTIEAYLLDYPGESLYGTVITLDVHRLIRPEQNFDTTDALVAQMNDDIRNIRG